MLRTRAEPTKMVDAALLTIWLSSLAILLFYVSRLLTGVVTATP